jgi:hypothetical protein
MRLPMAPDKPMFSDAFKLHTWAGYTSIASVPARPGGGCNP